MNLDIVLVFVASFAIAASLSAYFARFGARLGLVDPPGERKVHTTPIPKGGGLAIFAAAGCAWLFPDLLPVPGNFWLACAIVVLLGLLDDLYQLPWWVRLPVQSVLALWTIGTIEPLHLLAGLIWIVGLINAFNMIDNMDAQSAGVAAIAALALGLFIAHEGSGDRAWPYFYLVGATGGFLVFNWPPAKLFMGDAGSTYLGFFLAAGTLSNNMIALPQLAGTLTILALPWYDLVTVVSIRLSQGRSPFHADKQHLAHRLTDQGLSKPAAVRVIHALAISSGALGVAMLTWSDHFSLCALLALLLWLSVAILDITLRLRLRKNA